MAFMAVDGFRLRFNYLLHNLPTDANTLASVENTTYSSLGLQDLTQIMRGVHVSALVSFLQTDPCRRKRTPPWCRMN